MGDCTMRSGFNSLSLLGVVGVVLLAGCSQVDQATTVGDAGTAPLPARADAASGVDGAGTPEAASDAGHVAVLPVGLVAAYGFNEASGLTAHDSSGNGNTGTVAGATWTASGKLGGALSFDGTASAVNVASASSLDLGSAMTLEAWVYPTTSALSFRAVVAKNYGYYLYASVAGYCGNGMPLGGFQETAASSATSCAAQALAVGAWTHLAVTYDGASVVLYENGAEVATAATTGAILGTTGSLQIGASQYGEHFAGSLDEVRIYNRALSAAEIASDMVTPLPVSPGAVDAGVPDAVATAADASHVDAGPPSALVAWEDTADGIHPFWTFDFSITDPTAIANHADFVWGVSDPVATYRASNNPHVPLSFYIPFTRDPATHDLAYWQGLHPDWVVYTCDQVTPAYEFGDTTNVPLDMSNPAVIAWQLSQWGATAATAGYDLIAADNFQLDNGYGACGVFQNGTWKSLYTGAYTDPQFAADAVAWVKAFGAGLHALSPKPIGLIPNFQLGSRSPTDPAVLAVVDAVDAILDECGFTACDGTFPSETSWNDIGAFAEYVQSLGKPYFSINQTSGPPATNADAQWALASYLMTKEHGSSIFISGQQEYGQDLYRPEYAAAVGTACGAMQSTQGVYTRELKHSVAIVNPSGAAATFTLPAGSFVDLYGNAVSGSVSMAADTGLVLLDTGGPRC